MWYCSRVQVAQASQTLVLVQPMMKETPDGRGPIWKPEKDQYMAQAAMM